LMVVVGIEVGNVGEMMVVVGIEVGTVEEGFGEGTEVVVVGWGWGRSSRLRMLLCQCWWFGPLDTPPVWHHLQATGRQCIRHRAQ
jgi:hypothetical protein